METFRDAILQALRKENDLKEVSELLKIMVKDDLDPETVVSLLNDFISAADQVIEETK